MTLLDPHFRRQCDYFDQIARRSWGRRFLARRPSARLAAGTDVTGHSDYIHGDELRYVDWNVSARHDELLTKRFDGREDQHVYVLLDCSASMQIGCPCKFAAAQRLAAGVGYLALANLDCVRVLAYTKDLVGQSPAWRGRQHGAALLKFIEQLAVQDGETDLTRTVASFADRSFRPGQVVVISDLFVDSGGIAAALDRLRWQAFQPYLVHVYDRSDADPEFSGRVSLREAESSQVHSERLTKTDLQHYRMEFRSFCQSIRAYCAQVGIGLSQIRADEPFDMAMERMIRVAGRHVDVSFGVDHRKRLSMNVV